MNQEEKKQLAAKAAFDIVFPSLHEDSVIGIGTGSTTNQDDRMFRNKNQTAS